MHRSLWLAFFFLLAAMLPASEVQVVPDPREAAPNDAQTPAFAFPGDQIPGEVSVGLQPTPGFPGTMVVQTKAFGKQQATVSAICMCPDLKSGIPASLVITAITIRTPANRIVTIKAPRLGVVVSPTTQKELQVTDTGVDAKTAVLLIPTTDW